jgi:hypothetical protein
MKGNHEKGETCTTFNVINKNNKTQTTKHKQQNKYNEWFTISAMTAM